MGSRSRAAENREAHTRAHVLCLQSNSHLVPRNVLSYVVLFLLAASPPADAGAQPANRDPLGALAEYANVVEDYRRGGVERIEAELKQWDAGRIGGVIALLERLRKSSPILLDTRIGLPDAGGWSMPLIGAAALLHADVFLQRAKRGMQQHEQLDLADRFLALYAGRAADPSFRLHVTLSMLWMRQITGQFAAAERQLGAMPKELSEHPEVAVAGGCLEEVAASPRASRQPFTRDRLERAAAHYRRALSHDPQFAEARVRLGYVLLRLGRADEASRELEGARQDAREPRTTYLAALFLGIAHERAGRYQDAAAAYRNARGVAPQCQVAAVALSHLLYRVGDRKAAAAIAREAAGLDDTHCEDPWWSYDYGQAYKLEETMAALRREVHR